MTIKLQRNNSDKNVLNKSITNLTTMTGYLKNSTSILKPTIVIEGEINNIATCNYMFIPDFYRWYFITDIRTIADNICEIDGNVDVLYTYRDDIRKQTAIIRKQSNDYNLYLNDGTFKVFQYPQIVTLKYNTSFPALRWVLIALG